MNEISFAVSASLGLKYYLFQVIEHKVKVNK